MSLGATAITAIPYLSFAMTDIEITPSLFDYLLTDDIDDTKTIPKKQAENIMQFFKTHNLFNWNDSHNGCEARAEAICALLQAWNIPCYKAWVFSGYFLKRHIGGLKKNWNYHVATVLLAKEDDKIAHYIIDPATSPELQTLYDWAAGVTDYPHSYHFVKEAHWYIFSERKITKTNWNRRNRQNQKWMIQGLAGINGLSSKGKAALVFNKRSIKNTIASFEKLKKNMPSELGF